MLRSFAGALLVLLLTLSLMSADARGPGRRIHVDDDGLEFNDAQEVITAPLTVQFHHTCLVCAIWSADTPLLLPRSLSRVADLGALAW